MNTVYQNQWQTKEFEDVARIATGQVSPLVEPFSGYYHIGPDNVDSDTGRIENLQLAKDLGLTSGKYLFDAAAIVYSKIRPNLNKVCMPTFVGICSADMYPLWPSEGVLKEYLYQYMRSPMFLKQAVAASMRTGLPKINREDLNRIEVPIPSIDEQQRIAAILATWDQAIDLIIKYIGAKQQRKYGLMQQLLAGRRKFAKSRGWSWRQIGELFVNTTRFEPWDDDRTYVQAIVRRWSQGIEVRQALLGRDIKTKNLQVVHAGDFLISDIQASYGAMSMVGEQHNGLYVSNVYTILVPKSESSVYTPYFDQLSRTPLMRHLVAQSSNGFKAERIRLSFVRDTFLQQKVYLPDDVAEQRQIADVLGLCDEEIRLLNRKLALLKQQKQGLMQQLLAGKVRLAA